MNFGSIVLDAASAATWPQTGSADVAKPGIAGLRWLATHNRLIREEFQELLRASLEPSSSREPRT
jgi:hypothetical protein